MQNRGRVVASFCLFALMTAAGAATPAVSFTPETSHYFNRFDPSQRPWEPGQPLNIEEVFKNYQYFEILLDRDDQGMVVNQYIRGSKTSSENTGSYRMARCRKSFNKQIRAPLDPAGCVQDER